MAVRSNGITRPRAVAMAWNRPSRVRLEMIALLISSSVRCAALGPVLSTGPSLAHQLAPPRRAHPQHDLHDPRIELPSCLFLEHGEGRVDGACGAVRPVVCYRVERGHHREHPGGQGDLVRLESLRIPLTVVALVMT